MSADGRGNQFGNHEREQRQLGPLLRRLRDRGWMVAAHNDYRQDGRQRTFWLFTHLNGTWVKGEGDSDIDALQEAMRTAAYVDTDHAAPRRAGDA